jgi:hypothetical protein
MSNLFTYFLSLFLIPAGVANHREQLQASFLNKFKFHLVRWSDILSLIVEGELGV